MSRFEAFFDCGETDERLPQWEVVEWFGEVNGVRTGARVTYADDQEDAERTAQMLNIAYERQLFNSQGCEFDCDMLM
jgi:hypothetical protein